MVENGGNFRDIFIEEPAERRSVNLTTVAEYEQKQAKSYNHKWVNMALTWMAHKNANLMLMSFAWNHQETAVKTP